MSSNGQTSQSDAAVIVVNFPMPSGHRFEWHTHEDHQLAWAPQGVLAVLTDKSTYVLPPTRGLWIPVGVRHETRSTVNATMRALYVRPARSPVSWTEPTPVTVTPLMAELIGYLGDETLDAARRSRGEELLADLLSPVPTRTIDVAMPTDRPARNVAQGLLEEPSNAWTLAEWGHQVGASDRTLERSFLSQTGLPFGRWRTLVRLQAALPRLAAGETVSAVAIAVGYETASAFTAAFRRETGTTPRNYFALAD
jgi:AraC-like DNA-binding protein/quercetin dioxygenase-like cupin family protein